MKHWLRIAATLLVTGGAVAYILLKIDLGKTWDILARGEPLVARSLRRPDVRHGAADGLALAAAARGARRASSGCSG